MSAPVFNWDEAPDSRSFTTDPPSITFKYVTSGETNEGTVWSYALGASPGYVPTAAGLLYRQDIRVDPAGYGIFNVSIPYAQKKKETGAWSFSFDTAGATVKIKVAREHMGSYPLLHPDDSNKPHPDGSNKHRGSIGVKLDSDVDGCDIVIPALKLNVQFKHPAGVVTMAQVKALARATGTTNLFPFLTFDSGELLYLGSSGSEGTDVETEVAYIFAASENVTDLTFGDITGIVKKGHWYAWVEFEDTADTNSAGTKPKRVHIERVYNEVDFAAVFGWS